MEEWLGAAVAWYGPATVVLLLALAGLEVVLGRDGSNRRLITNLACWLLGGLAASWLPEPWFGWSGLRPFAWIQNVAGATGVLVAAFVILDLFSYAMHRLEHRIEFLWRLHAVHHADPIVDASTGVRHHPGEVVVIALAGGALFAILGLPGWAIAAAGTVLLGWAMVQHADLPWPAPIDRMIAAVLITPALHRIHHSALAHHHGANFGTLFSVWDRLLGTLLLPDGSPLQYGIGPAGADTTKLGAALLLPWRLGRGRLKRLPTR